MSEDKQSDLQTKIAELTKRVEKLETQPINSTAADARVIARMQSNTSWSIHYSTVRMTVGTFFITTCLTILGFKWSEPTLPLVLAAATIWTAGLLLFLSFTKQTVRMRVEANAKRNHLLLTGDKVSTATVEKLVRQDGPRTTVIVLTVLFVLFLVIWSAPIWSAWFEPHPGESDAADAAAAGSEPAAVESLDPPPSPGAAEGAPASEDSGG